MPPQKKKSFNLLAKKADSTAEKSSPTRKTSDATAEKSNPTTKRSEGNGFEDLGFDNRRPESTKLSYEIYKSSSSKAKEGKKVENEPSSSKPRVEKRWICHACKKANEPKHLTCVYCQHGSCANCNRNLFIQNFQQIDWEMAVSGTHSILFLSFCFARLTFKYTVSSAIQSSKMRSSGRGDYNRVT